MNAQMRCFIGHIRRHLGLAQGGFHFGDCVA
jgi:hypothetical protein